MPELLSYHLFEIQSIIYYFLHYHSVQMFFLLNSINFDFKESEYSEVLVLGLLKYTVLLLVFNGNIRCHSM
jgi:hypothetical protein